MNGAIKIITEILLILIVWLIITLILFIAQMLKSLKKMTIDINHLTDNIEIVQEHINKINRMVDTLKPVTSVFLLASLLNSARKDYKKTKSDKRNVLLSLAKVGVKNISTIKKIKFI